MPFALIIIYYAALTPSNFRSISTGSTSILLAWSQAPGEMVNTYNILYSFQVSNCPGAGGQNVSIIVSGSSRQHNLTGLQEDSLHAIRIIANDGTMDSAPAQIIVTTLIAGNKVL